MIDVATATFHNPLLEHAIASNGGKRHHRFQSQYAIQLGVKPPPMSSSQDGLCLVGSPPSRSLSILSSSASVSVLLYNTSPDAIAFRNTPSQFPYPGHIHAQAFLASPTSLRRVLGYRERCHISTFTPSQYLPVHHTQWDLVAIHTPRSVMQSLVTPAEARRPHCPTSTSRDHI